MNFQTAQELGWHLWFFQFYHLRVIWKFGNYSTLHTQHTCFFFQWGIRQNMHKMGFKTLLNNFILFIFDINFLVTKVTECLKEDFLLKRWADVKVWLVGLGAVTGSVNLRRGGDRQGATRKGRFAVYHC